MAQTYLTPGVHWEQHFSPPAPSFLTGVPVFLGLAERGEVDSPKLLTHWPQYGEMFGLGASTLPDAVQGFFGNGGRACYVLRLRDLVDLEKALAAGLEAIASLDTIDLVCAPDLADHRSDRSQLLTLQQAMLDHCEEMGDRFAILDAPAQATLADVQAHQKALSHHGASRNGALYYPWIQVQRLNPAAAAHMPPCGHIAGIYAQSDGDTGVHKAPANVVINGAVDVSVDLSNVDQSRLNPIAQGAGVNCIQVLPGRGIRLWGARTLSEVTAWRHVNVRRLFLMVGRWVDRNLSAFAFEPNDLMLWIRIERELTAYLESLLAQGMLQGNSPEEAFFIKCDAEINTPEVLDRGMVITEIGLAPTVPSEFIVVRLIQGETGVTLV
ncbi:phage tail sheath family protein [Nodosilinea sp. FACHB-131]|nr:phage tail sheath family protein [Nodosilinea sp. FACHB-131]